MNKDREPIGESSYNNDNHRLRELAAGIVRILPGVTWRIEFNGGDVALRLQYGTLPFVARISSASSELMESRITRIVRYFLYPEFYREDCRVWRIEEHMRLITTEVALQNLERKYNRLKYIYDPKDRMAIETLYELIEEKAADKFNLERDGYLSGKLVLGDNDGFISSEAHISKSLQEVVAGVVDILPGVTWRLDVDKDDGSHFISFRYGIYGVGVVSSSIYERRKAVLRIVNHLLLAQFFAEEGASDPHNKHLEEVTKEVELQGLQRVYERLEYIKTAEDRMAIETLYQIIENEPGCYEIEFFQRDDSIDVLASKYRDLIEEEPHSSFGTVREFKAVREFKNRRLPDKEQTPHQLYVEIIKAFDREILKRVNEMETKPNHKSTHQRPVEPIIALKQKYVETMLSLYSLGIIKIESKGDQK